MSYGFFAGKKNNFGFKNWEVKKRIIEEVVSLVDKNDSDHNLLKSIDNISYSLFCTIITKDLLHHFVQFFLEKIKKEVVVKFLAQAVVPL